MNACVVVGRLLDKMSISFGQASLLLLLFMYLNYQDKSCNPSKSMRNISIFR